MEAHRWLLWGRSGAAGGDVLYRPLHAEGDSVHISYSRLGSHQASPDPVRVAVAAVPHAARHGPEKT